MTFKCINSEGKPVTADDLDKPAWLATSAEPHTHIYIYGACDVEHARELVADTGQYGVVVVAPLPATRRRRLIAPLSGDPAGGASYVIIDVTDELRLEVSGLRELANKAKNRMGGSVDITLRGKVDAVTLCYIDPEELNTWWDSFADRDAPAWVPEDVTTDQIAELTEAFRSECHGIQVWDAASDGVRFTCYPKSASGRVESSDLDELLYPLATREVQL